MDTGDRASGACHWTRVQPGSRPTDWPRAQLARRWASGHSGVSPRGSPPARPPPSGRPLLPEHGVRRGRVCRGGPGCRASSPGLQRSWKHRGHSAQRRAGAAWPLPADGAPAGPSGMRVGDLLGEPFRGAGSGGDPGVWPSPPQHDRGARDTPIFQLRSGRPRTLGRGPPGVLGISGTFRHILGQLALLTLTRLVGRVVLWDPGGISEDRPPAAPLLPPACPAPPLAFRVG